MEGGVSVLKIMSKHSATFFILDIITHLNNNYSNFFELDTNIKIEILSSKLNTSIYKS